MVSNSQFLSAIFGDVTSSEAYLWVNSFRADPNDAPVSTWGGRLYKGSTAQREVIDAAVDDNTFFSPAALEGLDGSNKFRRSKQTFKFLGLLGADDADFTSLNGTASYVLETSPGKHQIGIFLDWENDADCANLELIDAVMQAMADARLISADKSGNNAVRYMRLPVGTNTKSRATGPFRHNLKQWNPEARYTLEDAVGIFGLDLELIKAGMTVARVAQHATPDQSSDYAGLIASLAADNYNDRSYHDPLLKLSAKFISGGMHGGMAVETLRGLMLAVKPGFGPELERWQSRYNEIPRMVSGAERKYAPAVDIALKVEQNSLLLNLQQLADATKNVRWMVKTLIPADAMGMLFGASGTFKSFIALDLCLHVAHGLQWCGRKTAQGSVVYVAAEGGAGIYRRIAAWHKQRGLSIPDNFHVCTTPLLLTEEEQVSALRESIKAIPQPPTLVVVDTLSQTFSGDENSSTDVANYLRLLNTHLRAAFNCSVLVVHHTGHAAAERPRGSSAITANLDFLLGCFRPNPEASAAQLEVIKQKDGDKLTAQYFEMQRQVLEKDEDGDEVSSLVAEWHDAVKAVKDSSLKLNVYEQALLNAMPEGMVVVEDDLKGIIAAMVDNAETRRKSWTRAINSLREKRLIRPVGPAEWRRV